MIMTHKMHKNVPFLNEIISIQSIPLFDKFHFLKIVLFSFTDNQVNQHDLREICIYIYTYGIIGY